MYQCKGEECEFDGVCDKNGCAYNPYRIGNPDYYGLGLEIDTTRPFTVVTQFPSRRSKLTEIHRLYIQDGKVFENAPVNVPDIPEVDFMNDEYCDATGSERFMDIGAMRVMGEAMSRGMVLAMSIWWDEGGFMQWLDGDGAGPCNKTEGDPDNIRKIQPDSTVTFSNIKWGEIGSTFKRPRH